MTPHIHIEIEPFTSCVITLVQYISISFWYSDVFYTGQVLEVVRNGKNSIFWLILLNLSANKPPFNQYYPKSVPNPDSLMISKPKNIKMLVLAKISFLTVIPILQCKSVALKCTGGEDFGPKIFFKINCCHMFQSLI